MLTTNNFMEKPDKQIRNDFHTIKNIVLTITLLTGDIKYFKADITEEKKTISEYKFLWRTYNSLYINLVLELNKLFEIKGNYSFSTLLNKIQNNYKRISRKRKEELGYFLALKEELNVMLDSEIIFKLKQARNKYYAHLDINRPISISVEISEIENLMKYSQGLVNKIYGSLEETEQGFLFTSTDVGHYIFEDLYNFNLIRNRIFDNLENDVNPNNDGLCEFIMNKIING